MTTIEEDLAFPSSIHVDDDLVREASMSVPAGRSDLWNAVTSLRTRDAARGRLIEKLRRRLEYTQPHVWVLDAEGRGRSYHATAEHAKQEAERLCGGEKTYWRYDENEHRLKAGGETLALVTRVAVQGAAGDLSDDEDGTE